MKIVEYQARRTCLMIGREAIVQPQYQLVREIVAGVVDYQKSCALGRGFQDSDFSFQGSNRPQLVHFETREVADHCHAQVDPRTAVSLRSHIRCTRRSHTS
jgi:hypothetical protein